MFARTLGANYGIASDEEQETAFHWWNSTLLASLLTNRVLVFDPSDGWMGTTVFCLRSEHTPNSPSPCQPQIGHAHGSAESVGEGQIL